MSDTAASPGAKALAYAEQLGVNSVHENAQAKRAELDKILTELSEARDLRRDLESRLTDREMEVAGDERGRHPEMAETRMKEHLKVALNNDDDVREYREQIIKVIGDIEGLEYDKELCEVDIRIAVARLQELGGYFQYLAAVKQAETSRKLAKQENHE